MKKLIYILLLILVLPVWAGAATYYMRADGTAANEQAATGPCGTQANAMSVATHNANWADFSPNDIIKLCDDGGAFLGQLAIGSSGTSGNPITYEAEDGDSPVIDANGNSYAIYLNDVDWLVFDGIKFQDGVLYNVYQNGSNNTYQNCEFTNATQHGIAHVHGDNLIIQDSSIYSNGYCGYIAYKSTSGPTSGNENILKRNSIYSNGRFGVYVIDNYHIVEHNKVYDNGNVGGVYVGIEFFNGANDGYGQYNIARYNLVYGQISGGDDGEGIYADEHTAYTEIYGNIIYGNDGPGIAVHDATYTKVYNNTVYGNCQNSSTELNIFTEMKVVETDAGVVSNTVIKNNVFQAIEANTYAIYLDSGAYDQTGLDIDTNDYYAAATNWYFWNAGGGNNLATWNALTGVGTDLNSDPLFTNAASGNFQLNLGSPAATGATSIDGYNTRLRPESSWPDDVQTMNDNLSIGAYGVYRGAALGM